MSTPNNVDWKTRWKEGHIFFHQDQPNDYLVRHFSELRLKNRSHCLVPLSGKTLDIPWIAKKGHQVTGVEISSIAIDSFFQEQKLTAEVSEIQSNLLKYSNGPYSMIEGDFFDLSPSSIPKVDWIYDRAALVAIPRENHKKYVDHLSSFITRGDKIFLISFEYDQKEMEGPPFSVTETMIQLLFSETFEIKVLEQNDILEEEKRFKEKGLTKLHSGAYLLNKKA